MNRLVVVSNRVPPPNAGATAGGLAVALSGLMAQRGGLWFGWSGTVTNDHQVKSNVEGGVQYATIDLSETEHDRYYNEFSNSTLWPLLHSMPELMTFDRRNAQAYHAVNERMAASLAPLLRPTDQIWIHDYHLMAVPAMLRARGVAARIGVFLHIPFPSADMLASVPEAGALIRDRRHPAGRRMAARGWPPGAAGRVPGGDRGEGVRRRLRAGLAQRSG